MSYTKTNWVNNSEPAINAENLNKIENELYALDTGKVDTTTTVNGHALSGNVTVTKSDVGLGNVDNTSDADKPVSTATQNALNGKVGTGRKVNGHTLDADVTVTASDVGLGNVPNVTTDNQTPTVTEASTRANLATGDTLKTIVGKVKKFFADLGDLAFINKGSGSSKFLREDGTWQTVGSGGGVVTGVKGNSESSYRTGDVNLTPANLGISNLNTFTDSISFGLYMYGEQEAGLVYFEGAATMLLKIELSIMGDVVADGFLLVSTNGSTGITYHCVSNNYASSSPYNPLFSYICIKSKAAPDGDEHCLAIKKIALDTGQVSCKVMYYYGSTHNLSYGTTEHCDTTDYTQTDNTISFEKFYHYGIITSEEIRSHGSGKFDDNIIADGAHFQGNDVTMQNGGIMLFYEDGISSGSETAIINAQDGSAYFGGDLTVDGSVQLGTSTVGSSTQPIYLDGGVPTAGKSINDVFKANAVTGAKNMMPYPYADGTSKTFAGSVTATVQSDGSVKLNGTATSTAGFLIKRATGAELQYLNGLKISGSPQQYVRVRVSKNTSPWTVYGMSDNGSEAVISGIPNTSEIVDIDIVVVSGTVIDNKTAYPMIRPAEDSDSTYHKPVLTNEELDKKYGTIVTGTPTDVNTSMSLVNSRVQKSGNVVSVWVELLFTANMTLSGNVKICKLPWASANYPMRLTRIIGTTLDSDAHEVQYGTIKTDGYIYAGNVSTQSTTNKYVSYYGTYLTND